MCGLNKHLATAEAHQDGENARAFEGATLSGVRACCCAKHTALFPHDLCQIFTINDCPIGAREPLVYTRPTVNEVGVCCTSSCGSIERSCGGRAVCAVGVFDAVVSVGVVWALTFLDAYFCGRHELACSRGWAPGFLILDKSKQVLLACLSRWTPRVLFRASPLQSMAFDQLAEKNG